MVLVLKVFLPGRCALECRSNGFWLLTWESSWDGRCCGPPLSQIASQSCSVKFAKVVRTYFFPPASSQLNCVLWDLLKTLNAMAGIVDLLTDWINGIVVLWFQVKCPYPFLQFASTLVSLAENSRKTRFPCSSFSSNTNFRLRAWTCYFPEALGKQMLFELGLAPAC